MYLLALVCVCLSVCDHDNKKNCGWICTKFYAKVPRAEREDQVCVLLQSVEGFESNGQKTP